MRASRASVEGALTVGEVGSVVEEDAEGEV